MYSGKLITFEGLDGAGKTTQAELLVGWLKANYKDRGVLYTKEPTNGVIGSDIRLALKGSLKINDKALGVLFAADRSDHLQNEIIPALADGKTVVCDRYYVSSFAFQSLFLDLEYVKWLNAGILKPDVIILLTVTPEISLKRLKESRGTLERYETQEILEKVATAYSILVPKLRGVEEQIVEIDGTLEIEEIHKRIIDAVGSVLPKIDSLK